MTVNDKKHCKECGRRGAILLIAVTVASLVLAIGLGILNLVTKEIILSIYSRESGKAFYASNTGLECALFWDISYSKAEPSWNKSPFATSSTVSLSETSPLHCSGQEFNQYVGGDVFKIWEIFDRDATKATTRFKISAWSADPVYGEPLDVDNPCVEITIEKYEQNVGLPQPIIGTKISAIGYNTCNEETKYRVSRGIRVQY